MKEVLFFSVLCFLAVQLCAQEDLVAKTIPASRKNRNFRIPLIGETAPSFVAESTNGKARFPSDYGKSWKILFSNPQDFTPVCSSEILELANLQQEFNRIGAKLVVAKMYGMIHPL